MNWNSLPSFPTPPQAVPAPGVRGHPPVPPARLGWTLLVLWGLASTAVMVYFYHRTLDAIENPAGHAADRPIRSLLPDASEVERIKVVPTEPSFEERVILAADAWANARTHVAGCGLALWRASSEGTVGLAEFEIPAARFPALLSLFRPSRYGNLNADWSWGYDLYITTRGGEEIRIKLLNPDRNWPDGGVVAVVRRGTEGAFSYVSKGRELKEAIVKARWARE